MEKEAKRSLRAPGETEFVLQWGSRKRLRCIKIRDEAGASPGRSDGLRRATSRINRRVVRRVENKEDKEFASPPSLLASPIANHRKSESAGSENRKSPSLSLSPEKEDRFYTTRGSVIEDKETGSLNANGFGITEERGGVMSLPRLFVSLSNKEKEEDFMAMKGCKLPVRPRKRSKLLQKCLLLVSPGAWLTDLSHERYQVREEELKKEEERVEGNVPGE